MGERELEKYSEISNIEKNKTLKEEIGKRIAYIRNGEKKKNFAELIRRKPIIFNLSGEGRLLFFN